MKNRPRSEAKDRARILSEIERVYLQRMLENVDTWWPAHALKNPAARKDDVTRRLASLIDKRPRNGFDKSAARHPRTAPNVVFGPTRSSQVANVAAAALFGGQETGVFGRTSGVVQASAFKWYDVEAKSRSDTQDMHVVSPLGASGWAGAGGANFWGGFTRLDSLVDDINIFSGSPADRVVHMAVLRVTPPAPSADAHAVFRTSLFVNLPLGAEVLNEWGFFDDQDAASIRIDLCSAVQPGGGDFPEPSAFTFSSALSYGSSKHDDAWREVDLVYAAHVAKGVRPNVYVGVRLTFEGADCRLQTGFTQHAADASFGFRYPSTFAAAGLSYAYAPNLSVAIE